MEQIGQKIRKIMREMGLTQSHLARELGVSQPSVSQYLKGRVPSAAVLQKLSQLSGYPVEFFLEPEASVMAVREEPPQYNSHSALLAKWERLNRRQQQIILDLIEEFLKRSGQ